jgi:rod shape-determining protein MreC
MESLLNRYRNITVLLLVIFAQLMLLAFQVKNDRDVRFIRVWTVTAVTPFARVVEGLRGGGLGFVRNYILLHDTNAENQKLREEVGRLKMDNIFLRNELNQADRAKALQLFQAKTPSKTLAATIIGSGAGSGSRVVFIDRGSAEGVERGMAVVTPDGIVGKVTAAYPTASQVMLITDADFAAGVISQKNGARGTLKGQGTPVCKVDYVPFEDKIEVGETLYTSGDDRVFPRGFPAAVVKAVHQGTPFKEILADPTGLQRGLEDVLVILSAVHQAIPEAPVANQPVYIAPPPPAGPSVQGPRGASGATGISGASGATGSAAASGGTEADKLRAKYKAIGDAQNHTFGEGPPGSKPPNFNYPAPGATGPGIARPSTPSHPSGATGGSGPPATSPGVSSRPLFPPAPPPRPVGATGGSGASAATGSGVISQPAPAPTAAPHAAGGTGGSGSSPATGPGVISRPPAPITQPHPAGVTGSSGATGRTGANRLTTPGPPGAGASPADAARRRNQDNGGELPGGAIHQ